MTMKKIIQTISQMKVPFLSYEQLYLDLGTSFTRIAMKDKGVVLREPTVLGFNKRTREYIFFGKEAQNVIGKVPEFIEIQKPVISGVITEFDAEVALLHEFLQKALSPYMNKYSLSKPSLRAAVTVPTVTTEIEKRAVKEMLYKNGFVKVLLFEKPMVTAIGCGHNVFLHEPCCIVDLGGGLVEIAIISGGGVVAQKTLKTAGDHMNKQLYNYLYLKHGIILGEITLENLKTNLLNFTNEDKSTQIRGKSLESGLPKSAKVKSADVREALLTSFNQILDAIKEIIEQSPPEVVDTLYANGIILTGGIANASGIAEYFSKELGIQVRQSENRETSTIQGLLRLGRRKEYFERLKLLSV